MVLQLFTTHEHKRDLFVEIPQLVDQKYRGADEGDEQRDASSQLHEHHQVVSI